MDHEEYLVALQLISDEGPGKIVRRQESQLDRTDAESQRQLGVV